MQSLVRHTGVAAPLLRDNVDTDAIIPSRRMSRVSRRGLGRSLFANWRYLESDDDTPDPAFVLNRPAYRDASILIAGRNFGCGSSREHAVWALADFGIRVIMAPSFGGIFESNCWQNGILPIALPPDVVERLAGRTGDGPFEIDLEAREIRAPGLEPVAFDVAEARRADLMAGADAIDRTLAHGAAIEAARVRRNRDLPWAVNDTGVNP